MFKRHHYECPVCGSHRHGKTVKYGTTVCLDCGYQTGGSK